MVSIYILLTLVVCVVGFLLGRKSGFALYGSAGSRRNVVHSLPSYHGLLTATLAFVPMILVLVIWASVAPGISRSAALSAAPAKELSAEPSRRLLEQQALYRDIQMSANLLDQGKPLLRPELQPSADVYNASRARLSQWLGVVGLLGGIAGIVIGLRRDLADVAIPERV